MKKFTLLSPVKNTRWQVDALFLILPILMLLPGIYNTFINPDPDRLDSDGTVWVDGSFDALPGVAGFLFDAFAWMFLIFFVSIPVVAAIRIFNRIRRHYSARQTPK